MLQRIKGTQDFLNLTLYNFLIDTAKKHLNNYNFTEISTPVLEPAELFKRSLGLETDVVSKEMYTVVSTGSEEKMSADAICLRPEMTASTVRAFLNAPSEKTIPWKVFSHGPVFRHERPQKGRYRQFHQLTMEIIGSNSIAQDAYFITMLNRFFAQSLTLDSYALLINFLGCPADRQLFKKILHAFLETHANTLCTTCTVRKDTNIMRIFDCKNATCKELYQAAPLLTKNLCTGCSQEWQELQKLLQVVAVPFTHAPNLVRGLDYYNKTVFEFVGIDPNTLGAQNAFCGGGRYDSLAKALGAAQDQPAIGAAMGIERLLILLEQHQEKLVLPMQKPLQFIIPLNKEQQAIALTIANKLHAEGKRVDLGLEGDSVKSMMRKANKLHAEHVIIIGPDEAAAGTATIKNMATGTETHITQNEITKSLGDHE